MKYKPTELSKLAGVGKTQISNEIKRGHLVKDKAGLIDSTNTINQYWLMAHGVGAGEGKHTKKKTKKAADRDPEKIVDIESASGLPDKLLDMTLRELLQEHKNFAELKMYVEVLDKIMSARKKDIDAMSRRSELIPRHYMEFYRSYINNLNNLLFDFADSSVNDIIALIKADEKRAKVKLPEYMRKHYSKFMVETIKQIDKEAKKMERNAS